MFFLLLLFTGALSQCNDPLATNNGAAVDCIYSLKIGSAVPKNYHGEWGIEAAAAQLNSAAGGYFELGANKLRFRVDLNTYAHSDSAKDVDEAQHAIQVDTMIKQNDFIVGGGPWYAEQEVTLTNNANKVSVLCCTGPDQVYQTADAMAWNGAFGVHAPPEYYPQHVIRHANAQGAKKVAIIYAYGNVFTTQVASKNKDLVDLEEMELVVFKSYPFIGDPMDLGTLATSDPTVTGTAQCPSGTACLNSDRLDALAQEIYDSGAEVVISCGMNYDAYYMAKQLKTLDPFNIQFKAVFFTVGATKSSWIASTEQGTDGVAGAGQYVTSGGQWDPNLELCGDWFGPGWPTTSRNDYCSSDWNQEVETYVRQNKNDLSYGSNYETASGAVALYTLIKGIAKAYENDNIVVQAPCAPSAVGTSACTETWDQTKVRDAMRHLNVHTFFGAIGFNMIQRNDKKESVTVQWLPNAANTDFEKKVIYPVSGAEATFVYPSPSCKDNLAATPECQTRPSPVGSGSDEDEDKKDNTGMIVIIVVLVIAVILLGCVVMFLRNRGKASFENNSGL